LAALGQAVPIANQVLISFDCPQSSIDRVSDADWEVVVFSVTFTFRKSVNEWTLSVLEAAAMSDDRSLRKKVKHYDNGEPHFLTFSC